MTSLNVGFSGSNLEYRWSARLGRSGETARPILSGMLLLENILGGDNSSRGGTGGGIDEPPHGCKFCFPEVVCIPPYISETAGSVWKGSISLPRLASFLRRKQTTKAIAPITTAAPPTPATLIPTIWFFVSPVFLEEFCVGGKDITLLVEVPVVWDRELVVEVGFDNGLEIAVVRVLLA